MKSVVIVFPFNTREHKLLLIEEYIQHYGKSFWKYVSGGVDKEGKDLLTHAEEELAEELGLRAEHCYHFHHLEKIFGNREVHFFVAENVQLMEHPPENPDTDIILQSKWVTYDEFIQMLDTKQLMWDQASMAALMVFRSYQKK